MVSIKVAAALLALVCIFHLNESSAFLVKRDADTTESPEDKVKSGLDDLKKLFDNPDVKRQGEELIQKVNLEVNKWKEELEKMFNNIETKKSDKPAP